MTVPPSQPSGWQPPGSQAPYGPPGQMPTQPVPGGYPPPPPGGYPPPPGTYLPAGGGYPAPQPPVSKRIPEDQSFIAYPSVRKRAMTFAIVPLAVLIMIGCLFGLATAGSGESPPLGLLLGMLAVLLLPIGLLLGFQLWLITSGGPVLAVGPAGLWIKTRPTRGQAIWLPWEGITEISRRRWGLEKMVVVKPHDPRVGGNLGVFTALDSSMLKLFYGSGFIATLSMADKPESEIMAAIAHFSAGRCHITW